MSHKTLLFTLGALALAACANPTEPRTADAPAMLVRPPLPTPQQQQIAFTVGPDIYVSRPDGFGFTRLVTDAVQPALSPDGSKIAFTTSRNGNGEVWVMTANTSGTGLVNLSRDAAWDWDAAWSPDGSKIAFSSHRDGNFKIYVVYADGTGPVPGFIPPLGGDPAWSPDGSKIAFTRNPYGGIGDIYVMNATNGSVIAQLTFNPSDDQEPAWSPDGSKIAFSSNASGNYDISVMDAANGSGRVLLTFDAAGDGEPAWSPDGSQIAFSRCDVRLSSSIACGLYFMNAANGEQGIITGPVHSSNHGLSPSWISATVVTSIEAHPDLIVESLTHSPANPTTAQVIRFTAVVKNVGHATAGASILEFLIGGETPGVSRFLAVPALGPGQADTVERYAQLSVAQHYRNTATADVANAVAEPNEMNNVRTDDYWVMRTYAGVFNSEHETHWLPSGNPSWYYSAAGTHRGELRGPDFPVDFDLSLERWNVSTQAWETVAESRGTSSNEQITYNGTAGYYRWRVYAYNGFGGYEFRLARP